MKLHVDDLPPVNENNIGIGDYVSALTHKSREDTRVYGWVHEIRHFGIALIKIDHTKPVNHQYKDSILCHIWNEESLRLINKAGEAAAGPKKFYLCDPVTELSDGPFTYEHAEAFAKESAKCNPGKKFYILEVVKEVTAVTKTKVNVVVSDFVPG